MENRGRLGERLDVSSPKETDTAAEGGSSEEKNEQPIGPADAAAHWQAFYRSIRDAVDGLRK